MNNKKQKKTIKSNASNRSSSQKKQVKKKNNTIKNNKKKNTAKSNTTKNNTIKASSKTGASINKKIGQNKKNNILKYKRRRRLLVLIVVIVFVGVITIYKLKTPSINRINKYMTQGNNYILNNQYQNAINSYEEVTKLDKTNQQANDLVQILQCYIKAQSEYKEGNASAALQTLDGINPDYMRYPIGIKVNQLKSQLDSNGGTQGAQSGAEQTKQDLMTLNSLYSSGQYQKALEVIKRLDSEDLNSTQQAYVSEIASSVEQSLGSSGQGQTQFSQKGKYLNGLNGLTNTVNNMDPNAQSYEQKLQKAKDQYNAWNDELNKIYTQLQNTLNSTQLSKLQSGQADWVKQKNQQATASEAQYSEQIVKETANYQTQRDLAKQRCYYLVNTYM
ncbi:MAG: lysozyme inhibitor LprI family protein [Clostridium sp.]